MIPELMSNKRLLEKSKLNKSEFHVVISDDFIVLGNDAFFYIRENGYSNILKNGTYTASLGEDDEIIYKKDDTDVYSDSINKILEQCNDTKKVEVLSGIVLENENNGSCGLLVKDSLPDGMHYTVFFTVFFDKDYFSFLKKQSDDIYIAPIKSDSTPNVIDILCFKYKGKIRGALAPLDTRKKMKIRIEL